MCYTNEKQAAIKIKYSWRFGLGNHHVRNTRLLW